MKYVIAIIRSHELEDVRDALPGLGTEAPTVVEVRRFGSHEEHTEFYRAAECRVGFLPKTEVELAVAEELVERAVEAVREAATTGRVGDGRICVLEPAETVQIMTGRTDAEIAAP
jgi:nitrogen regulatory protein P-II 2